MTVLRLDGVTVARGGRALISGIDLTLAAGTFVGILGANGIGKTSLLLTLAGQLPAAAGRIELDGVAVHTLAPRARARRIAVVDGQEPIAGTLTVERIVAAARYAYHRPWEWRLDDADRAAIDDAIARVKLGALRMRAFDTLSAGERQRVWIALALAQRADVIVLDEPTSHLDLRYAVDTLELLRELCALGTLVIAALHVLEEAAAYCDRVVVIGERRILADGPPDAALDAAAVERAFGIPLHVERNAHGMSFARRRSPALREPS